jgi:hypothetical protein
VSHDPQSPSDAADFEDDDGPDCDEYDCSMYWTGEAWHCPLLGSEECDWECPNGGMAPDERDEGKAP